MKKIISLIFSYLFSGGSTKYLGGKKQLTYCIIKNTAPTVISLCESIQKHQFLIGL